MKQITLRSLFTYLVLLSITAAVAQEKIDPQKAEAWKYRYDDDAYYAKKQRGIYKNEEWKASWVGVKVADMYSSWGTPVKSFPDGKGGQILVYEKVSSYSGGDYIPGYTITKSNFMGETLSTEHIEGLDTRWTSEYQEVTTVYTDANGIITKVDHNISSSRW